MVAILVQTICFVFVIYCGFATANKPGNPPGSSVKTYSHSQASSSKIYSSSSHTSSVSSTTPVNCVEDKCDRNSTYKECPNPCPKTCGNPKGVQVCSRMCLQFGCECKPGYVVSENGKCVNLEDCPDYLRCNDLNAEFKECPSACPRTCAFPGGRPCTAQCLKEGCECKQGFYLNDYGKCVALQDCPGAKKCSSNETFVFCNVGCPNNECPVDDNQGIIACDPPYPCGSGCSCNKDYLRNKDGRCILYSDCPPIICTRPNEMYSARPPPCLLESCTDIGKDNNNCERNFPNRPQCICKPGFFRNEDGVCVPEAECHYLRCNDLNAEFKECPSACPRTCAFPGGRPCTAQCLKEGCECKQGFYLNDYGKCVALQDCPGAKKCSCNETFVFCNVACPNNECPVDENQGIIICDPTYPCGSGCSCNKDYLRSTDGRCILYSDCPPIICTRPNEMYSARPPPCLLESCTDIGKDNNNCERNFPNRPQCICKPGFFRNEDGVCVPEAECPKPPPICGENEIAVECKTFCPPQSCEISYTDYFCTETPCTAGCDCIPNHLRNSDGVCIPNDQCPPPPQFPDCGVNEVPSLCKITCPPQSCASLYTRYNCTEDIPCEWGCDCEDGYLRNDKGLCILSSQCPNTPPEICGYNEVFSKCKIVCPPQSCESIFTSYLCSSEQKCQPGCNCLDGYLRNKTGICVPSDECFPGCDTPPECRPTCANPVPNCTSSVQLVHLPSINNQEICQCEPGYILSEINGVCIRIEECPDEGCNCDPNSIVTSCPWPYPSTCEDPEAGSHGRTCQKVGCQCKPGYILSDNDDGECILPDDCECGDPCGANGTFSECAFRCPNQYCPKDDRLDKVACKPGRPCPSGCNCKPYYLRKSYDDESCVLASDCPLITCTRPNEKYDACSSECLTESCDDLTTTLECYADPMNCQPRCVCIDGYKRDKSGTCVREEECPQNCKVQQECRPTCAVPNPENCPYIPPAPTNIDSCNCQSGYVLSEVGGKCIKIEECPKTQSCNGDKNAFVKQCPLPCPSTCESPNATPCKKMCLDIGCECKPGYLKSKNGKCILPDQCKGGNPCGMNATFTACKFNCPTNYCPVDDSRAVVVCETSPFAPCFSGCSCKLNYRLRSREDPRCILSTDCRPVKCTRPNEKWNSCPSDCNSEYCDAVGSPATVCNTLVLNCNPRCLCRKGYFRNDKDVCVSSAVCHKLNMRKKKNHS